MFNARPQTPVTRGVRVPLELHPRRPASTNGLSRPLIDRGFRPGACPPSARLAPCPGPCLASRRCPTQWPRLATRAPPAATCPALLRPAAAAEPPRPSAAPQALRTSCVSGTALGLAHPTTSPPPRCHGCCKSRQGWRSGRALRARGDVTTATRCDDVTTATRCTHRELRVVECASDSSVPCWPQTNTPAP